MRIFYDANLDGAIQPGPGGISNFFDHLISRVAHQHPCLFASARAPQHPHPSGPQLRTVRHRRIGRPVRLNLQLRRYHFALAAGLFRPDLIHATFYNPPSSFGSRTPLIVTAFDMIDERWAARLDPDGARARRKLRCFEAATAIPCISASCRDDLLALYPHLEPKVSVIPLAGGLKFEALQELADSEPRSAPSGSAAPYLLYVGTRHSYKNVHRLLLAFARVAGQLPTLRLKLVGAPLQGAEIDLLEALELTSRVDLYSTTGDVELYRLYRQALAFIYPSLYEGFGIPPLEAMALNTPVLAANTSSIPEVTGDAALLFNPWSVQAIAEAILQIAQRPELREELRRKGQRRQQRFSWDHTAAAYLDLYARVCASPSPCSG